MFIRLHCGKTYLCELMGAFAGPGGNSKVSYPRTSEEATKSILSLLLTNPAVIEFDDMDSDWKPHGAILRMLTAEHITDRILGHTKTATVSTRTLFLGSGNNVGPIRYILRRVLTIHIDPRTATPATMSYKEKPVEKVPEAPTPVEKVESQPEEKAEPAEAKPEEPTFGRAKKKRTRR